MNWIVFGGIILFCAAFVVLLWGLCKLMEYLVMSNRRMVIAGVCLVVCLAVFGGLIS